MTRPGSSLSRRMAPSAYVRSGPTPWVITSQPASVSSGDPLLPIWIELPGPFGDLDLLGLVPEAHVV